MAHHNDLGQAGEQAARDFLIARGWIVREQNWHMNHLELDLVAEEPAARLLHIIEVKTRSSDEHFNPLHAITRAKQLRLINAANAYINIYQLHFGVVFDVMIIVGQPDNFHIQFIPNAFQPPLRTYR